MFQTRHDPNYKAYDCRANSVDEDLSRRCRYRTSEESAVFAVPTVVLSLHTPVTVFNLFAHRLQPTRSFSIVGLPLEYQNVIAMRIVQQRTSLWVRYVCGRRDPQSA